MDLQLGRIIEMVYTILGGICAGRRHTHQIRLGHHDILAAGHNGHRLRRR